MSTNIDVTPATIDVTTAMTLPLQFDTTPANPTSLSGASSKLVKVSAVPPTSVVPTNAPTIAGNVVTQILVGGTDYTTTGTYYLYVTVTIATNTTITMRRTVNVVA